MPVFKRYKGRRITQDDPNWNRARWWLEFRLRGERVEQAVTGARTKAQAERAESTIREEIYNRRYNKATTTAKFSEFVDRHYLPWAKGNKLSYADDERRCKMLKEVFGNQPMREITPLQIDRFKFSLVGKKTRRGTARAGATVNRYLALLSKIFSIAFDNGLVDANPVKRVRKEKEGGKRERYLTVAEGNRLMEALTGELRYLRPAVVVSIGTGLRKSELLRLQADQINFSDAPKFHRVNGRDVEIPSNWLLVEKSKNRKPRIIPMNATVRNALLNAIKDASGSEHVFSLDRNGVDSETIRSGFATACEKAEITFGQTKAGGLTWHDLRHTFATRLRGQGVHELDIMQLLGHSSLGVTTGYAHGTPTVIQNAVDRLAQGKGEVVPFAKAS
jgi:integrase